MNCSWEAEWRKHHLWNENDGRVTWGLGVLVWSEHWIISLGQLGGGWVLMVSWLIPKNDHYKGLTIYLHRLKTKQLLSDSKRIWLHLMMSLEKDIWDPLPSEKKKKRLLIFSKVKCVLRNLSLCRFPPTKCLIISATSSLNMGRLSPTQYPTSQTYSLFFPFT